MSDDVDQGADAPAGDEAAAPPGPETRFGVPVTSSRGQTVLHPTREQLVDLVPAGVTPERFEVVVGLLSHATAERLRLRVQVPGGEPTCPTLFDVHPGTEALEREVFDMFGITFTDHPDMSRILMPEDWEGYPLRKDNPVGAIPVQFKGVRNDR